MHQSRWSLPGAKLEPRIMSMVNVPPLEPNISPLPGQLPQVFKMAVLRTTS